MKVSGLKVWTDGTLEFEGRVKACPYCSELAIGEGVEGHVPKKCGDWCAMFSVERPFEGKLIVRLNCSNVHYEV